MDEAISWGAKLDGAFSNTILSLFTDEMDSQNKCRGIHGVFVPFRKVVLRVALPLLGAHAAAVFGNEWIGHISPEGGFAATVLVRAQSRVRHSWHYLRGRN